MIKMYPKGDQSRRWIVEIDFSNLGFPEEKTEHISYSQALGYITAFLREDIRL